jgi:hypothetical protein
MMRPIPQSLKLLTVLLISCCLLAAGSIRVAGQTRPSPQLWNDIKVYVSVIDPKIVSDIFGKRVAQRFVAIQVTISNKNEDFQFLIHDVSLDLKEVFGKEFADRLAREALNACDTCVSDCIKLNTPKGGAGEEPEDQIIARQDDCNADCAQTCRFGKFELSSLELSLIRGVAEKGQGEDTRNKTLRYFRAVGTIAAGLIGVASFGPSYPKSVAVFNGPIISAYSELYPDYTINQMNRLSDTAYKSNSLVPKQQAKVLVAFIPQAIFLTSEQRKKFWNDPTSLYPENLPAPSPSPSPSPASSMGAGPPSVDFRKAIALVEGSFITEVQNLPPLVTGVRIDPAQALEFLKSRPVVEGFITGQYLRDTDIDLLSPPEGMDVVLKGKPDNNRLYFTIRSDRPVPRGTVLNFRVFNNQGSQTITMSVTFMPPVPTLEEPDTPLEGVQGGGDVEVELTGQNLITDVSKLVIDPASGVTVSDQSVIAGADGVTKIKATLKMANAKEGDFKIRVLNSTTQSNEINFKVKPAESP